MWRLCHITPHRGCESHITWDWRCGFHIAGPNPLKGFCCCDCPIEKAFLRISVKFQFKRCGNYFYIFCLRKSLSGTETMARHVSSSVWTWAQWNFFHPPFFWNTHINHNEWWSATQTKGESLVRSFLGFFCPPCNIGSGVGSNGRRTKLLSKKKKKTVGPGMIHTPVGNG